MIDKKIKKILNLHKAWLSGDTNAQKADLRGANLRGADLRGADLRGANLHGANLRGAQNVPPLMWTFVPPECGTFTAWKKVRSVGQEYIIKLQIPEDAQRSSATTRKCRASAAKVLEIQSLDGTPSGLAEVVNHMYEHVTVYKVGEITYPDSWDEDRWNECSHGIHFFITRQEAVDY